MDKPALDKDLSTVEKGYQETEGMLEKFFELFKGGMASDVPDEL